MARMKPEKTIEKLKTGEPLKLVALGDSLTYGWMVKKDYLDFLSEMLAAKYPDGKIEVYNVGIPGDTAEGGLRRLHKHVLDMNPDIVSVQFGLNDMFSGYSTAQFEKNMAAIIQQLKQEARCDILLMTSVAIPDPHDDRQAELYYSIIIEIARQKQLPVALVHAYWKKKMAEGYRWDQLVQADQVHPTEEGHRLMAEAIMEVF
jgi:lysophospholipase L1-like esterase